MSKQALRDRLIEDYQAELEFAQGMKKTGVIEVRADTAGSDLAKGRERVPIDEYIKMWQDGLTALLNGADPEPYNF